MLIQVEQWELQLGPSTGAVVVYTKKDLRGQGIELWLHGKVEGRVTAQVVDRRGMYAAIFPSVPAGNHTMLRWDCGAIKKRSELTVFAGHAAEVDWR